jgi:ribonucleotide reductase alpha subunit
MTTKPYYWLNSHSRLFLERGYLEKDKTPEQRIKDIAINAEKLLNIKGFAEKFEHYMSLGYYSLSTPVWTNYGNQRGLPVSCFNSHISDRMDSILYKVAEVGMMSKLGGGTSGYFGNLRGRGASISVGGESSGPVHFMELFDKTAEVISQGSARRGSFAAYLPVEHSDIEEFLQIRNEGHPIQNMSIGVTISDEWMNSLIQGDKNKRKIWAKIIQKRFETGYPYIMFSDTVNNNSPKAYKDQNLSIKSSNLCVAPYTLINTKQYGKIAISEILGQKVDVWNGLEWSNVEVVKTGINKKLLTVLLSNNSYLTCTPEHKWYIIKDNIEIEKRTYELEINDYTYIVNKDLALNKAAIVSIIDGGINDTYCVNEPKRHRVDFNGILTGNCSEITLSSDENNSFVCVLSSLNLLHWDEIEKTDAIETLIFFLDSVNQEFINKTENIRFMKSARNFALNQRALGMGVLGWHSYLQSKMISFESMQAKLMNSNTWQTIRERVDKATKELAEQFGEAPILEGYGRRNVTTLAVAPTTSSSFILGQVSPSIEPLNSNYFVKNLAKGKFTYKNPYLKEVLKKYEKNDDNTWKSILVKGGSVQHLKFLSTEEKEVFKTFGEISQKEIVIQASQRQKYIDQSQSLNIMIGPDIPPKQVSDLLIEGWRLGIKTFYYQRSANPAQELARNVLSCHSCES